MEWKLPKLNLSPGTALYGNIYCKYMTNRYPCAYCGGKYRRNIRKVIIDKKSYPCCEICYHITHLNASTVGTLCLCYSVMTQTDIIRKTVDYIKEKDIIPFFDEIDKNVKIINLSMIEYCNILTSGAKLPKNMENYKIFLTENYDISCIDICAYIFCDDENDTREISNYDEYVFSKNEKMFLENFFN